MLGFGVVWKGGHPSTIITVKVLEGDDISEALGTFSMTLSREDILFFLKILHQITSLTVVKLIVSLKYDVDSLKHKQIKFFLCT